MFQDSYCTKKLIASQEQTTRRDSRLHSHCDSYRIDVGCLCLYFLFCLCNGNCWLSSELEISGKLFEPATVNDYSSYGEP